MQDRINNMETIMRLHEVLMQEMADAQVRLDASQRQMAENQVRIAENLVRINENLQTVNENQRLLEGSQLRTSELLQKIIQTVAVMQADIVRIDEASSA